LFCLCHHYIILSRHNVFICWWTACMTMCLIYVVCSSRLWSWLCTYRCSLFFLLIYNVENYNIFWIYIALNMWWHCYNVWGRQHNWDSTSKTLLLISICYKNAKVCEKGSLSFLVRTVYISCGYCCHVCFCILQLSNVDKSYILQNSCWKKCYLLVLT